MKKLSDIDSYNDCDSWGDFIWFHLRGFLLLILVCTFIVCGLHQSLYYINKNDEDIIENTRYCPNCGYDLIERRA